MTPFPGVSRRRHRQRGPLGRQRRGRVTSSSPSRGPACCAASAATTSATGRPTGRGSPACYFAGDGAKRDEDGDLWLLGRVDDVMNISGHRISTTEVEHALVGHPAVAEAAVVGASDPTTGPGHRGLRHGQGRARRRGRGGRAAGPGAARRTWPSEIGPIAKPRQIMLTPELPKTRSGKIMRRLLRDVADDRAARATSPPCSTRPS